MHMYETHAPDAFSSPELPAFSALLQPRSASAFLADTSAETFTYQPIASLAVGRAHPNRHAYPQFQLPSFRLSSTQPASASGSPVASDSDGSPTSQRRVTLKRTADDSPSSSSSSASALQPSSDNRRPARASRYLREADRHAILQRIENGEKQADLAKEYNVSRAAISNLKQRRKLKERQLHQQSQPPQQQPRQPLSHSSDEGSDSHRSLVRPALLVSRTVSPSNYRSSSSASASAADRAAVHRRCVVRGPSTALLLSQLQRRDAYSALRVPVQRLSRQLLEEALGRLPTQPLTDGGLEFARPVCAVAVGAGGRVLLDEFRAMEPGRSTGFIALDRHHQSAGSTTGVRAVLTSEPALLAASSVLLLQLTSSESAEETIAAVETLESAGVDSQQIVVVTLVAYWSGLTAMLASSPRLGAVVTTHALTADEAAESSAGEDRELQDLAQRLRSWLSIVE